MIDYNYPTIASGLLPSGALSAHPIENKDEEATVKELMDTVRAANISTTMKLRLHSRRNIERLLPSGATREKLI
jgi:hypothetical protein